MTIAVISAKGGVGKTTTTANVGAALATEFGRRVLIIDGNITTPTLGIHLGILSQERTLDDVLNGKIKLSEAVYIHPCGVHIVPSSLSPTSGYPDPDILREKIKDVKDSYDVILIDGAAGIGKEVIATIRASDDVLIVTNPDMASIVSAIKAIKIVRSLDVPIVGITVNRSTNSKHELKMSEIEDLCEARVISTIPFDEKINVSLRKMTPIVLSYPESKSSIAFKSLAAYLVGEEYKAPDNIVGKIIRKLIGVG